MLTVLVDSGLGGGLADAKGLQSHPVTLSATDGSNNPFTHFGQHCAQFPRHAGGGQNQRAAHVHRKADGTTARVMNDGCPSREPGLLQVGVVGFDAARRAPVPHMLVGLGVQYQFDARCRGHQLGSQVILGGTQPAVHDQDARRAGCPLQGSDQPRPVVPQRHFLGDAVAERRQRLGDHR